MDVLGSIADLRQRLRPAREGGLRIGLVPTMGALHRGHLSLVAEAKKKAELIVCSIFVNPIQFGPHEDLARYPRTLEADVKALEAAGCDLVFAPSVEEMYPPGFQTRVEVLSVSQGLCGASRPTHFAGVTTVVLKLFALVGPDVGVFGEKDYQQLVVLRTMVRDLGLPIEVLGAPIVRDDDGLALSSRNVYLSPEERARATGLFRGLSEAKRLFLTGERSAEAILRAARAPIEAQQIAPEYLELRSAEDLRPLARAEPPAVILVAARVGQTRLIDNIRLEEPVS